MAEQFCNMKKDYQNNVNSEGNQSVKKRFAFVDFSIRSFGHLNVSDSEFIRPGTLMNTVAVSNDTYVSTKLQPLPVVPNTSTATETTITSI